MPRKPKIAPGVLVYHLHSWPLAEPAPSVVLVNRPESEAELKAIRQAIRRSSPFGSSQWQVRMANQLDLQWPLRPRGRPPQTRKKSCVRLTPPDNLVAG